MSAAPPPEPRGPRPLSRRPLSRRRLLGGALGAGAVLAVGGGCSAARRAEDSVSEAVGTSDLVSDEHDFRSEARGGQQTGYRVLSPREHDGPLRPVLYLHGLGGDAAHTVNRGAVTAPLLAAARGGPGIALVTVDTGRSYVHRRASGEDAGAMIRRELLPRLRDEAGLDTSVLGLAGFSMGGYGALLLASTWDAATTGTRVAAVAVADPALWLDAGDSAPGAFDDREDFEAHDVMAEPRLSALRSLPVWMSGGDADPFRSATEHLRGLLGCAGDTRPGGHDEDFQRAAAPDQFAFLAARMR